MLGMKTRIRMSHGVEPDPRGCDNLHRTAEVLRAKLVPGNNPSPAPTLRETKPFQVLKARSGTRVAIRPVSPPPSSPSALVMSLVSLFLSLSPSGNSQESLQSSAIS